MKKIKVTLRRDGSHDIEVLEAAGDECLAFTRPLEERLGAPAGARTLKPEFEAGPGEDERESEREDARG